MSRRQCQFVRIQQYTEPSDHFVESGAWVDVGDPVYAQVTPLSARESLLAQQVESQVTHRVKFGFRSGIDSKMRLRMAKPGITNIDPENPDHWRKFEIESIVNVNEANRELELMVIEVV